jgi:hypothetical protein
MADLQIVIQPRECRLSSFPCLIFEVGVDGFSARVVLSAMETEFPPRPGEESMIPGKWKTLSFCAGLSLTGWALCADQPGPTLHLPAAETNNPAPRVLVQNLLPPRIEENKIQTAAVQVREFEMELPTAPVVPVAPIKLVAEAKPAVQELAALPPLMPLAPLPESLPESGKKPKAASEGLPRVELAVPLPGKVEPQLPPLSVKPAVVMAPEKMEIPVPIMPLPSAPVVEQKLPPLPVQAPAAPVQKNPLVPVEFTETAPEIKPVSIPKPKRTEPMSEVPPAPPAVVKPEASKAAPVIPFTAQRVKLIITLGDGKPRFEVRNIDTNQSLLKVTTNGIDIQRLASQEGTAGEVLQRLTAMGDIRFTGPDVEGQCEELSILAGTGEVLLKGNVQLKAKSSKFTNTLKADKVVYQIALDRPAAAPAATTTPPVNSTYRSN